MSLNEQKKMRVLITGGSGLLGRALSEELVKAGYEVIVLSRRPSQTAGSLGPDVKTVRWDAMTSQGWLEHCADAAAIVNLAGENIGTGRWTPQKKRRIANSRLNATNAVVEAVGKAGNKPHTIIQASGIGYYGDRGDELLDENSAPGTGFLAGVATQRELAMQAVRDYGIRCAIIRIAPVLTARGGFLSHVVPPFRMFLGGHPGSGKQWFPWIHIDDFTAAVRLLIENPDLSGPFNMTSPNPMPAKQFYRLLAKQLHRPAAFPMPPFFLKLVFGEVATELLLSGQRAVPARLLQAGYEFKFPDANYALQNILTASTP